MKKKLTQSNIKALIPKAKAYEVIDTELKGFLLRVQPTGGMTYYFSYRNQEYKRKRYKIGSNSNLTPAQARDIAEKLAGNVANGIDIQETRKTVRKKAKSDKFKTLGGFIDHKYKDWVLNHRKSGQQTLDTLDTHFSQFNSRPLSEINTWIIDKWRTERLKAGISKATVNRNVATLKSAISKAIEWGLLEHHPLAKLKPLRTDKTLKTRYLSDTEDKSLRDALKARDTEMIANRDNANEWRSRRGYPLLPSLEGCTYADHITPMALLTINTGLRRGEVFNLQWTDINFHTKTLTVQGATAKSGETRHIPLNSEALEVLNTWKEQTNNKGLIFPNKDGKPFTTIKTAWNKVLADAKIKGFRWHDLRHDFASKLVMSGVPLNTVRELLGHSDLSTTLRYAHLAPDHKADAVAKISKLS